jgi:hypothetical protein
MTGPKMTSDLSVHIRCRTGNQLVPSALAKRTRAAPRGSRGMPVEAARGLWGSVFRTGEGGMGSFDSRWMAGRKLGVEHRSRGVFPPKTLDGRRARLAERSQLDWPAAPRAIWVIHHQTSSPVSHRCEVPHHTSGPPGDGPTNQPLCASNDQLGRLWADATGLPGKREGRTGKSFTSLSRSGHSPHRDDREGSSEGAKGQVEPPPPGSRPPTRPGRACQWSSAWNRAAGIARFWHGHPDRDTDF